MAFQFKSQNLRSIARYYANELQKRYEKLTKVGTLVVCATEEAMKKAKHANMHSALIPISPYYATKQTPPAEELYFPIEKKDFNPIENIPITYEYSTPLGCFCSFIQKIPVTYVSPYCPQGDVVVPGSVYEVAVNQCIDEHFLYFIAFPKFARVYNPIPDGPYELKITAQMSVKKVQANLVTFHLYFHYNFCIPQSTK